MEDKNGDNMALQYLSVIKKHKTLLPASMRALSRAAWGLPDGLRSGHSASCLPHSSSHPVSVMAFLRPRSRCRASAKSSHIPCVSPGLSSCCRPFSPVLIYSLLFLKYTQRPLAPSTGTASSPSPKYTPTRLSGTWAKSVGTMGPGVTPSSQEGRPKIPPNPSLWPQSCSQDKQWRGYLGRRRCLEGLWEA